MIYPQVFDWVKSGAFCLINHSDKLVEVRYSSDVNKAIASILSDIKLGIFNVPQLAKDYLDGKVEIRFLEEVSGQFNLRVCEYKWMEEYREQGYQPYSDRKGLNLRVVTKVESYGTKFFVVVKLKYSRQEITVGVFEKKEHADRFIEKNYKKISKLVYDEGMYTNAYRECEDKDDGSNPIRFIYEKFSI